MTKPFDHLTFHVRLCRPADARSCRSWSFVRLPDSVSTVLPSRGMVGVDGSLNGTAFTAVLEPDGQKGHWLKVNEALRKRAGVAVGDTVTLAIGPARKEPEPIVPPDLKKALAEDTEAAAAWDDITTLARRDWVHWIEGAKKAETRKRRISNACDMLASGKGRVCCFDRSGFYSKEFSAPTAADD
ncbi:MAG: YdeI/OmpD-associated family protein [Lysobacteraceae bacterium]